MGSSLDTRIIPPVADKELRKMYAEVVDDIHYEYGHDCYNGKLSTKSGLYIVGKSFKTNDEARSYLMDHSSKFEPSLAVQVGDFTKSGCRSKSGLELFGKIETLRTSLDSRAKDWVAGRKSAFIGCPNCDSKLARKYLLNHAQEKPIPGMVRSLFHADTFPCPLCFGNLLPETEHKRAKSDRNKLAKLENDYQELQQKDVAKGIFWLVGGWCSD